MEQGNGEPPGSDGAPEAPFDTCDQCGVPLPDPRREFCSLGAGCCVDCMARCEQAGRCGKVRDKAIWDKIERVRHMVRDPGYK
jgi:RNA polymerase-binding transcription factor DksA